MTTFIMMIHIFTCLLIVLVVLLQSGKGAEISASFGGSSQTVFGSSGGANFFTRLTSVAAVVFMLTSIALTKMGSASKKSLFDTAPAAATAPVPVPAATAPVAPAQAPGASAKK